MPRRGFLTGTLVLTLAGAASRLLGVFYVIALPRIVQGEGFGLYTAVKPVFQGLLILGVAGLPVAVAKLVAEYLAVGNARAVRRLFWISTVTMAMTGGLTSLGLILAAPTIAHSVMGIPEAEMLLKAVAPAAFFLAEASALRGFLQGMQTMAPIAVSQVTEQLVRVAATIVFALWLVPLGHAQGAAGAMLGTVAGSFASVLVLSLYFAGVYHSLQAEVGKRGPGRPLEHPRSHTLRRLFSLGLPLVLAQILWPAFDLLDTLLVPSRLQALGLEHAEAMTQLGYLGMAGQLMWLPTVLTLALSASLVPIAAESWALQDTTGLREYSVKALRVTFMFCLPAAAGLHLLAGQVTWLLFGHPGAGAVLAVQAFGAPAIGMQQVTSAALQGMGRTGLPVRNLLAGVFVKAACNLLWAGRPGLGVQGAAYGTLLGLATATILNYLDLRRLVDLRPNLGAILGRPIAATGVMAVGVRLTYTSAVAALERWAGPSLSSFSTSACATFLAILVGVVIYSIMILRLGGLERRDIEAVPYVGLRCARILTSWGWLG